jgi:hypothetical protein
VQSFYILFSSRCIPISHGFFSFAFSVAGGVSERPHSTEPTATDPSGLRRACSLSDLNRPNVTRRILPAPPTNVSGKKQREPPRQQQHHQEQQQPQQPQQQTERTLHGPPILRPSSREFSSNSLNRRTSRDNLNVVSPSSEDASLVPSYMKSTSASAKKEKPGGSPEKPGQPTVRRRPSLTSASHLQPTHAQSANDLNLRNKDEDTSSEDNLRGRQNELKPTRTRRSSSQDRYSTQKIVSSYNFK